MLYFKVKCPKLLNSVCLFSVLIAAQLCACLGYSCAYCFPSIWSGILLMCFLTALFLSMSWVLRGLKLQRANSLALLFFAVFDAHRHHTGVCSALRNLQPHVPCFILPHTDLLPTGILPSPWLDITRSLAELGEMENHPAAASITQGMTGIKSASWSRRSSLTSRWEVQNSAHLPGYTALPLVWFACSNLSIWKDEMKFSEYRAVWSPISRDSKGRESGKEKAARASSVREEWVSRGWNRQGGVCSCLPCSSEGLDLIIAGVTLSVYI